MVKMCLKQWSLVERLDLSLLCQPCHTVNNGVDPCPDPTTTQGNSPILSSFFPPSLFPPFISPTLPPLINIFWVSIYYPLFTFLDKADVDTVLSSQSLQHSIKYLGRITSGIQWLSWHKPGPTLPVLAWWLWNLLSPIFSLHFPNPLSPLKSG